MSSLNKLRRDINILNTMPTSSGLSPNFVGGLCSFENVAAVATNIKEQARMNIELFDDEINKLVNDFTVWSSVYRENKSTRFVEDVKNIKAILETNRVDFIDRVRWSDDHDFIDKLRKPVSFAYLTIFGQKDGTRVVESDDFWKCLDLPQLKKDLYLTESFKSISSVLVGKHAFDDVNKLLKLLGGLRLGCMTLSEQYEGLIGAILDTLKKDISISITDTIDFNKTVATVLGHQINAVITNTIQKEWYGRAGDGRIGNMATDTDFLLSDPREACTANNTDDPSAVDYLFNLVKADNIALNFRAIESEVLNIVRQIEVSSMRINKLADLISEIPEQTEDGVYNYALKDAALLLSIYGSTLVVLLKFVCAIAKDIDLSFDNTHTLLEEIKVLKNTSEDYIAKRIKNAN